MAKIILRIIIGIYIIGAVLWTITFLSTSVLPSDNPIRPIIISTFDLSEDFIARPKIVTEINSFDDFLYSDLFYNLYAFVSILSVIGLLVLTRSRNLIEKYIFLQAFALPRERDYWGKITDGNTHLGIPFAVVRVYSVDESGDERFIAQTGADLDGRYRLYLSPSKLNYLIEVKSTGYVSHRQRVSQSLIQGDNSVRLNIHLQKENEIRRFRPINQFIIKYRYKIISILYTFIFILSLITFLRALYSIIFYYNFVSFYNFIFYAPALPWNIFVLRERRKFNPGRIVNSNTKSPIANVTIKVFLSPDNEKAVTVITDQNGVVQLDLDHEVYKAKIIKPGYKLENNDDNMTEIKLNKDGYLKNDIFLKPLSNFYSKNTGLLNPFGS